MCRAPVGRSPVSMRYRVGCFRKSSRRARDRRSASSNVLPEEDADARLLIDYYHMHAVTEPIEFESSPDAYKVKLDSFEGPLDLLLHLIRKNEVNIYDIPIALITEQYLGYIELMQELNLDLAGEFLVMAATLIHIKSRTLLPRPDPAQDDPEEDPREALMRRLLEHQKFKAAAEPLHERETLRSAQWTRPDGPISEIAGEAPEPEIEVDLFSLISAFRAVVERSKQRPKLYMPSEQIPIEDRIEQLMAKLSETEACGFEDLFADVESRAGMIVTFLAMLEMIRLKLIRVFQSGALGPIRVYKRARPADAPKPIGDRESGDRAIEKSGDLVVE